MVDPLAKTKRDKKEHPTKSLAESFTEDSYELYRRKYERQRRKYEKLSGEITDKLRQAFRQIEGKIDDSSRSFGVENIALHNMNRLRTAIGTIDEMVKSISSPIRRYDIAETAFIIFDAIFNLAPYLPEAKEELIRERNRRAGKARGEKSRRAANETWRDAALEFFRQRRKEAPDISQAKLAEALIEKKFNDDLKHPTYDWIVEYIRQCEKDGLLDRAVRRPKLG